MKPVALRDCVKPPVESAGMSDKLVETLSYDVSARLQAARTALVEKMHALGLTAAAGWRVVEELRHTVEGTEWIFRPMHLREHAPHDLKFVVRIDHEGRPLTA
jgi:hypothetical protein